MKATLEKRQQLRKQHRRCSTDPSVFSIMDSECLDFETGTKLRENLEEPKSNSRSTGTRSAAMSIDFLDTPVDRKLKESVSTPCLLQLFSTATPTSTPTSTSTSTSTAEPANTNTIVEDPQEEQLEDAASTASASASAAMEEQPAQDFLSIVMDAIHENEWTKVLALLERDPSLARRQVSMVVQGENSTCLLVHYLCGLKDTPVSVVDALVTLHPASLLQKEQRAGRLPIHIAVVKDAFPELVRYLCQARPQALQVRDQEGNRPLHYACMYGSPLVLRYLLEACPEACTKANTRDRFPIHLVCARCYDSSPIPTQDLEAIVKAYPSALLFVDRFGRTPLHLAASVAHPQWQVLQVLISHAPEALLRKDKARKTPLACAKRSHQGNKTNDLIVSSLLEATKQEQRRRRQESSWLPSWGSSTTGATATATATSPAAAAAARRSSSRRNSGTAESVDTTSEKGDKDLYCCYG